MIYLGARTVQRISPQQIRCFSVESGPRTSLENPSQKDDPTRYRIPILTDNENTMWRATMEDQWRFGFRQKNLDYYHKAVNFNVFPKVHPRAIKNFNYVKHDFRTLQNVKGFSEFSDVIPANDLADLLYVRDRHKINIVNQLNSTIHKRHLNPPGVDMLTGSGWSHATEVGKSFGPPRKLNPDGTLSEEYDTNFDSRLLQVDTRSRYFSKGKAFGIRVTVAVGNGNGLVGCGMTYRKSLRAAMEEAREYAYRQLVPMPMLENRSIPYATRGRYHHTELHVIPANPRSGNKAHRIIKTLLDLAGYRDVAVKLFGRNTPESLCKAFFVTFQGFETPQEQADRTGRYVVRFDPTTYYMPEVLAAPRYDRDPVPYTAELSPENQGLGEIGEWEEEDADSRLIEQ